MKNQEIPYIFSVTDTPIKVTFFPTGHLVLAIDEYIKNFGYDEVPEDLQSEIKQYLNDSVRGKALTADDGKDIAERSECIVRAWLAKQK